METFEEMEARHMKERSDMFRRSISIAYDSGKKDKPVQQERGQHLAMSRISESICYKSSITDEDLMSKCRSDGLTPQRQEFMYLCHRSGIGVSSIAKRMSRDYTTIKHGIASHKKRNGIEE